MTLASFAVSYALGSVAVSGERITVAWKGERWVCTTLGAGEATAPTAEGAARAGAEAIARGRGWRVESVRRAAR